MLAMLVCPGRLVIKNWTCVGVRKMAEFGGLTGRHYDDGTYVISGWLRRVELETADSR